MRGSDPKICEISHHREFFLGLNTAVRDLYHTYQQLQDGVKSFPLLFYDFDDDSWSTYRYNYTRCRSLFRDVTHHPAAFLLRNRVDKMLALCIQTVFSTAIHSAAVLLMIHKHPRFGHVYIAQLSSKSCFTDRNIHKIFCQRNHLSSCGK